MRKRASAAVAKRFTSLSTASASIPWMCVPTAVSPKASRAAAASLRATTVKEVKTTTVDVRFISATNVDLEARVAAGTFRADLFFRLDGISVVLPALRERRADVVPLARMFAAFKRRHPGPLKLVLAGPVVQAPPEADGVVVTGVLSDAERWGALRGCCAFVHPSPLESFAIVLIEAWMCSKPALVNGWCRVTI